MNIEHKQGRHAGFVMWFDDNLSDQITKWVDEKCEIGDLLLAQPVKRYDEKGDIRYQLQCQRLPEVEGDKMLDFHEALKRGDVIDPSND